MSLHVGGGKERRVSRYVGSMEDETKIVLSRKIYAKFFAVVTCHIHSVCFVASGRFSHKALQQHLFSVPEAPEGQNYFKQSSTRLQFIIDRVVEMTLSMYQFPCRISAHVHCW